MNDCNNILGPKTSSQEQRDYSLFQKTLKERINNYFTENNCDRHFNSSMVYKIIFGVIFWGITYVGILFSPSIAVCMLCFFLHGISHVFLGLNIGHDASHNATFKNKNHNKLLSIIFFDFMTGINSYRWHLAHNASHHTYININKLDPNLEVTSMLRLSPNRKRLEIHYYQHIYVSFLYLLLTLVWIVFNDIKFFIFKSNIGIFNNVKIPIKEYVILIISKSFYFAYLIAIPIYFLSFSWIYVLIGFICLQFVNGFLVAFILQVSHIQEELDFPSAKDQKKDSDWIMHTINSTIDYGLNNRLFIWFFGALNLHRIHHMYPKICHVHYKPLTHILFKTLNDFEINFLGNMTPIKAYHYHLKTLKYFGQNL